MEQLTKSEHREGSERSNPAHPLVFLDAGVIIGYVRGDPAAVELFSAEAAGRIRVAVNGIVLQDVLLAGDIANRPEFEQIRDHLRVLPVDLAKAEALVPWARALRNQLGHSNDLLIVSSADECDFLVTCDPLLKGLVTSERPRVVTPEELVAHLRAA